VIYFFWIATLTLAMTGGRFVFRDNERNGLLRSARDDTIPSLQTTCGEVPPPSLRGRSKTTDEAIHYNMQALRGSLKVSQNVRASRFMPSLNHYYS
jgi:hypothetical protein